MQSVLVFSSVPAVLEHEAIAGLTGSKPTGLRGRSSSTSRDFGDVYSLDSLMKSVRLTRFIKTVFVANLKSHLFSDLLTNIFQDRLRVYSFLLS